MSESFNLPPAPPVMMTVAGSDCSGGAGIQADIKTAHALDVYGLTAVTCVVSEAPGQVRWIQEMETGLVADQVRLCLSTFPVKAIKTGMLYSPPIVSVLAAELFGKYIPLVVDPVMVATAGNALMKKEAIEVYESELIPLARLLTPNLDEAAALLDSEPITEAEQMADAASELAYRYKTNILLKGGHLPGECKDVLMTREGELHEWTNPKIDATDFHGTGCTLSAAITAYLAKGLPLAAAVEKGLEFINRAIRSYYRWPEPANTAALNVGAGLGADQPCSQGE